MSQLPSNYAVIGRLRDDLERIKRVVKNVSERLKTFESDEGRRQWILDAIAFQLQAFYTGTEAFLDKSLLAKGIKIEKGNSSHAQILEAALAQKLIPADKFEYLKDLTKFRHYARHGYGDELEEELIIPKAEMLPDFWEVFEESCEEFLEKLSELEAQNGN